MNGRTPEGGNTPMLLAAVTGDAEMIDLLIDNGADPNRASDDGQPVGVAVWFGHEEAADPLVAGGAMDLRDPGQDWEDLAFWAGGAADERELGLESWLASLHHLWFLWFLVLFVVGFTPFAWFFDRRSRRRDPDAQPSPWPKRVMWSLVPLVVLPQLAMGDGGVIPTFGPDTSATWIPLPHVLAYYALFFAFGAVMYGRIGRDGELIVDTVGHRWFVLLPTAVLIWLVAALVTFEAGQEAWGLASVLQVTYAWLMIFGLIGFFRGVLSGERYWVRYLSDASCCIFLIHLTLVIAFQAWVRTWPLPALVKFWFIVATVSAILLITYQLFVRYTPIGTLLNGPRTRPEKTKDALAN